MSNPKRRRKPASPPKPEPPTGEFYCSACGLHIKCDPPPVIFARVTCPRCQTNVRYIKPPSGRIILPGQAGRTARA